MPKENMLLCFRRVILLFCIEKTKKTTTKKTEKTTETTQIMRTVQYINKTWKYSSEQSSPRRKGVANKNLK